jgi:phosphonate transport system permease protein
VVAGLLLLAAVAWLAGDYELARLAEPAARQRAWAGFSAFLGALGRPDLSPEFLRRAADLALTTVALAVLGTALGIAGGFLLGVAASRNVVVEDAPRGSRGARVVLCNAARLAQDVLRGIPDFAWAILAIPLLGLGPAAGVAALALNVSGILGRIYSEIFDAVPARHLEPLRAAGAGPLQVFLYRILPTARAGVVSFTLLRWECAVRNSAVIGVVGGGGLGSEVFLRLGYGEYEKVLTLLAFLLLLTVGSDLVSQAVRSRMRADAQVEGGEGVAPEGAGPGRRRYTLPAALALLVVVAAWRLSPSFGGAMDPQRWAVAGAAFGDLLRPDLSILGRALASAAVPLSMAFLGTLLAAVLAAALAYPASWTFQVLSGFFTGERLRRGWMARGAALVLARAVGILSRSIPEVFWAMLLVSFFGLGTLPGMLALAVHSTGLLVRLFAEGVDAVSLRTLEVVHAAAGSRPKTFLYGAVPSVLPEWLANVFFQFESNVRTAVVLGIVGVGGLGFLFSFEFEFFHYRRAATYLLVMVALATALDRLSRRLGLAHVRTGE